MLVLVVFVKENVNFIQYMSLGNIVDSGLFGLFYGILSGYMDGVFLVCIFVVLIIVFNQQGYQLGFFFFDGFSSLLYCQVLFFDFLLLSVKIQSDEQMVNQWIGWLDCYVQDENCWFLWILFNGIIFDDMQQQGFVCCYSKVVGDVDVQIDWVLIVLCEVGKFDNMVVIIIGGYGKLLNVKYDVFDWLCEQLQVLLVIYWLGMLVQEIVILIDNKDVMIMLMQCLFYVLMLVNEYLQGEDLFSVVWCCNWVIVVNGDMLVIIILIIIVVFNYNGIYIIWSCDGEKIKDQKLQFSLLLQVLIDEKCFIVN